MSITTKDETATNDSIGQVIVQGSNDITKLLDELLIEATIDASMNTSSNSAVDMDSTASQKNEVADIETCTTDSTGVVTNLRNIPKQTDEKDDSMKLKYGEIVPINDDDEVSSSIQQAINKNGIEVLLEAFENSVCFIDDAECSLRDVKKINSEEASTSTTTPKENNNTTTLKSEVTDEMITKEAKTKTNVPVQLEKSSSHGQSKQHVTWWQKSAIRKAVSFLEEDLQQVVTNSEVIKGNGSNREQIPLFHRSEIITGQLLGRGSFSDVFEICGFKLDESISQKMTSAMQQLRIDAMSNAINTKTGRGRWAIKQLQPKLLQKENIRQFELAASDLVVEAAYISSLHHPNIIAVKGLPIHGVKAFLDGQYDSYFIIFDRLDETLDQRIHRTWKFIEINQVDSKRKTEYALQIANVVQYLHENRIIFRDLKPQNIGFSSNDPEQVILFDFGLCRELPPDDTADDDDDEDCLYEMSGVGTRRYMAPETINDSRYNTKADVYSWAIVFWEMLTETRPYAKHTIEEHRIAVCQGGERPPINKSEWPLAIQHLLKQSWHDQQHDRLSMSEVCCFLRVILGHQESPSTKVLSTQEHGDLQTRENDSLLLRAPPSPRGVINGSLMFSSNPPTKSAICLSDFLESMDSTTEYSTTSGNSFEDASLPFPDQMLYHRRNYNELTVEYDYGVEVVMSNKFLSRRIT